MHVLYLLGLIVISTFVVWVGSDWLEESSGRLAAFYQLPPVVQGALIAAIGSSFPEFSSAVIATFIHGDFELGVGAIIGSAIFNITVIPALSVLSDPDGTFSINKNIVFKETQFYIIAVVTLLITFCMAVIYFPVEGEAVRGTVTRWLALIPVGVYGLYLYLQWHDVADHESDKEQPDSSALYEWTRLVLGVLLIGGGVEGMVRGAIGLGEILNTPSFLWGLTVVAAGTSLPDAFYSIKAARGGASVTSIANVLGSNIFDLLICVPAGVLVAGSTIVHFGQAVPMIIALSFVTVILLALMRNHMNLTAYNAVVLLGLYALFITWIAIETLEPWGLTLLPAV